jgi:predicted enzyme related to lactoylglutathione lyase
MAAPIIHWEINAKNGKMLQEFYAKVFGWKFDTSYPNYGLVKPAGKEGIGGGIGQQDPNAPMAPPLTFYIGVDDLQACLDMVSAGGGRTVTPPTEVPGMVTYALFADPEGNTVGLVKQERPAPKKAARKKPAARPKKRAPARKARRRR